MERTTPLIRGKPEITGFLIITSWAEMNMKPDDEKSVKPWSYLALALASAIVPIIHFRGLNQALDDTRYPWGLHPIEILWLRDLGQFAGVLAVVLVLCFILSWWIGWFRKEKIWRRFFTATLLFWVWYSIASSMTLLIQLRIGNWPSE
jgi:hypothetical protein